PRSDGPPKPSDAGANPASAGAAGVPQLSTVCRAPGSGSATPPLLTLPRPIGSSEPKGSLKSGEPGNGSGFSKGRSNEGAAPSSGGNAPSCAVRMSDGKRGREGGAEAFRTESKALNSFELRSPSPKGSPLTRPSL